MIHPPIGTRQRERLSLAVVDNVHPERRCAPRYPVAVEIEVGAGRGLTVNLSTSGVYFQSPDPLQPLQEVSIVFPFAYTAPGARAACLARVLRVEPLPQGFGIAAQYDQIAFLTPRLD